MQIKAYRQITLENIHLIVPVSFDTIIVVAANIHIYFPAYAYKLNRP